jgi:2-C-methyl-D-erythritol 2,4-cyclodiphosphate synthase
MDYKIGIGYDIHRLVEGRKLFLGGLEIPYLKGLLGHSDGDALLHSICDALLGALALGDIGEHFPDSDPQYLNISSAELLKKVADLVAHNNYQIVNIDTVIIAQEPMLLPFKKQIQEEITGILRIEEGHVNVKAKTNEGLGELGRKEAIACYAVAIVSRKG